MKRCVLLAVLCASGLSACSRTESEHAFEPAPGEIAARVNGVPIAKAELELWAGRGRHGGPAADEHKAKALESLINRELVRQEAYKLRLHEDEAVAAKLAALRAQYHAAQRDELAAAFNVHAQATSAGISDADAHAYFERNAEAMRTEYHIMQIAYSRDPAAIVEAKRLLDAGEPFEEVAARRFPNLPAGQRPWDLGYLRWSQLAPEWRDEVARLAPGATTGVLKGAGERWWIIHVAAKRVNEAITFESERQVIQTMLQNERQAVARTERLAALRKGAEVVYSKP